MLQKNYTYRFDNMVPVQELEGTLMLALLAVESLHGRSSVRMMGDRFNLNKHARTCMIDAATPVGSDLAKIFTGLATMEYGEDAVHITQSDHAHNTDCLKDHGIPDQEATGTP